MYKNEIECRKGSGQNKKKNIWKNSLKMLDPRGEGSKAGPRLPPEKH